MSVTAARVRVEYEADVDKGVANIKTFDKEVKAAAENADKSAKQAGASLGRLGMDADHLGGLASGAGRGLDDLGDRADLLRGKASALSVEMQQFGSMLGSGGGLGGLGQGFGAVAMAAATAVGAAISLGEAALKTEAVAKHGKDAKTSVDDLSKAFADLKLAAGKHLAPGVDTAARGMEYLVQSAAGNKQRLLELEKKQLEKDIPEIMPDQKYGSMGATSGAYLLEEKRARLAQVNEELTKIRKKEAEIANVNRSLPDTMDAMNWENQMRRIQEAYAGNVAIARAYQFELSGISNAADVGTVRLLAMAQALEKARFGSDFLWQAQRVSAWSAGPGSLEYNDQQYSPANAGAAAESAATYTKNANAEKDRLEKERIEQGKRDWQAAVKEMENDWKAVWNKAQGYLQGTLGGKDLNPLAPGAGGPIEGAFRIADVAENLGKPDSKEWVDKEGKKHSPKESRKWKEMYFGDMSDADAQAAAKEDIRQATVFGNWDRLIGRGAVNKAGLDDYYKQMQAGEKSMQGLTSRNPGEGMTAIIAEGLKKDINTNEDALKGSMAKAWDVMEVGLIDRAKQSTLLYRAVDEMVSASLRAKLP